MGRHKIGDLSAGGGFIDLEGKSIVGQIVKNFEVNKINKITTPRSYHILHPAETNPIFHTRPIYSGRKRLYGETTL